MIEAFAIFIIDLVARKLDNVTGFAKITKVRSTKLIQLTIAIPASKITRYRAAPGQHVYLSIPPASRPAGIPAMLIHELLHNPFTVANVHQNHITIMMRVLRGPVTNNLDALRKLWKARPPINIEGPYGASRQFPNLATEYDRILLVAGGIGAAYTLPIYKALSVELEAEGKSSQCMKLVWSMRSAAEAEWATDHLGEKSSEGNVHLFITGNNPVVRNQPEEASPEDGSVELKDISTDKRVPLKASTSWKRPNLGELVDETFRCGRAEKVAVLVCGPTGMVRELRSHVGRWVKHGREVWWHDEGFGW